MEKLNKIKREICDRFNVPYYLAGTFLSELKHTEEEKYQTVKKLLKEYGL